MSFKPDRNKVRKIGHVMSQFYSINDMTMDRAIGLIRSIEQDLIDLLPLYQAEHEDYRLGCETYGYSNEDGLTSIDTIKYQKELEILNYISDRWGASFRMAWILGLINDEYR